MKILQTGATGFIGQSLVSKIIENDIELVAAVRNRSNQFSENIKQEIIGEIASETDWGNALKGVLVVIHTAARVHVMNDSSSDPLAEFRKVNLHGTMALAEQAAEAGVKRFVFISSIKVNGEATKLGAPFSADDAPKPIDPYGISKAETEQALLALASSSDMDVVIIRPVLVYGPNVKANFLNMLRWINRGVPLPFGSVANKRSLVALDNLVSFIIFCADYNKTPKAANQIFLISDGEDVSTTELLRKTAKALGKKPFLLPVPVWLMTFMAKLLGKGEVADRLFGSLQVDSSKARNLLGWEPVISMDEQLKKTAEEFLKNEKNV